jgi:uncharacterized hydrophobic protein (TIGR00271 family)
MTPLHFIRERISLHSGTDPEGTVQRITAGASLNAESLWLLVCSAIIASIGLDVGSSAVIIGAMLISPLMGPILGVGLGTAITHRALLLRSLRELGYATLITLAASTTYFLVSPLATPTAELVARTRPTLLDVGVALFGGIAGIVAGSRRHQSLALPGVAIATALMPPLCTAGFGLATGNWAFLLGASYLYGLNAVFIALATFLVVRALGFPHHEEATVEERRRERRLVAAVVVVAALPSTYFLYETVRGAREQRHISEFVHEQVEAPGRAAAQWEHRVEEGQDLLKIYIAGRPIDPVGVDSLRLALPRYGLRDLRLEIVQSDISGEDLRRFRSDVQRDLLRVVSASAAARDSAAEHRRRDDSLRIVSAARELATVFPQVNAIAYTPRLDLLAGDSLSPPAAFVGFVRGTRPADRRVVLQRGQAFLRQRLGLPNLVLVER